MEHPHEPIGAIEKWQEWYKNNCCVAELNEPLMTKDSRENLHDTSTATDVLPDWRTFYKEVATDPQGVTSSLFNTKWAERATDYFADTIAEFFNELTPEEICACFAQAAKQNFARIEEEYLKAKELMELAQGKTNG